MKNIYIPIGYTFSHKDYGNITAQYNPRKDCKGCVFFHAGNCKDGNAVFSCTNIERQDRKDVIFTKV